ncbi:MAG: DUF2461 domain-containing protein [Bacteroidia bacterium]|nr:DUF2461 domain-containing protein [Bacteroidia bacterium]
MIATATLNFLKALKKNNNKEWFDQNKDKYLLAKENMEKTVDDLIQEFGRFDKSLAGLKGKDCVFRIYKDVRFAKDKTPYKTNMGASINAGGKKAIEPVYYIHIEPGNSFLAGGIWMPPGDELKKIRQEIDYNAKALKKVLTNPAFKKYFGGLSQEYKLKTTPKGYPKDHPEIELLRYNSFIVVRSLPDKLITSKTFVKEVAQGAKLMKPFNDFLKVALS